MSYLVVHPGENGEEKILCADDSEAIALVESKLREGCADSDVKVYTAELVDFQVERVPVVTLGENATDAMETEAEVSQPDASDFPSASFTSYTTDEKTEDANPFSTEQVFSLDS